MVEDKIYIGVDISQDNLDMAAYPTGQIWQYKNKKTGIAKAVAKLKSIHPELIVMEATGGLELALKSAIDEAGLAVAVINPKRIRDYGRSIGMLAKTDKLDAKVMAHFAAKIEPQPQPPRDKAELELDNLVTRRNQISDMITAEKNRLKEHLNQAVQQDIKDHILWLDVKLKTLNKIIKEKIDQNPEFKEKSKLYKSMKGVGDVFCSTLMPNCLN